MSSLFAVLITTCCADVISVRLYERLDIKKRGLGFNLGLDVIVGFVDLLFSLLWSRDTKGVDDAV